MLFSNFQAIIYLFSYYFLLFCCVVGTLAIKITIPRNVEGIREEYSSKLSSSPTLFSCPTIPGSSNQDDLIYAKK